MGYLNSLFFSDFFFFDKKVDRLFFLGLQNSSSNEMCHPNLSDTDM